MKKNQPPSDQGHPPDEQIKYPAKIPVNRNSFLSACQGNGGGPPGINGIEGYNDDSFEG